MRIFDAHLHLDDSAGGSAKDAVARLEAEMTAAGVERAIVLHLAWQPWSMEEFAEALEGKSRLIGFANVVPSHPGDLDRAVALGFQGMKLHPRLQNYRPNDAACVELVRRAGEIDFPVIADCFPDGDWLMADLSVRQYAELARQAPATKIVVAHAAGHHCLDLLMLMKRVPNLWTDISYSLLYYDRPVVDALFYCLRSLRHERVLFGTDYPDRSLPVSVASSLELFQRFGLDGESADAVLWKNAEQLLRKRSA